MIGRYTCCCFLAGLVAVFASSARAVTINFETEDDFATPLIHGQSIYSTARVNHTNPFVPFSNDTKLEFNRLIRISSTVIGTDSHLGPAIFDSDPADTTNTSDRDLLVGLGNVLMLQRDEGPNTTLHPTNGLRFNNPSDEGTVDDQGSIVIDFLVQNVHLESIDLIDIDNGTEADVILTDRLGRERTYSAPAHWTTDVTDAPTGYKTLNLQTLLNQPAALNATGGPATVVQDAGFNDLDVVRLEVQFLGVTPSGAIDNLVFTTQRIPEPAGILLGGLAAAGGWISRRKSRAAG